MKVLIISDDENFVTNCSSFLEQKQYNVIVYKWLLKALDNIEEIKPDIIILSTSEYPRHWKTLIQFVSSGIGGNNVKFYLYEPNPLSPEEQKKAECLNVAGAFASTDEISYLFDEMEDDIPQVCDIVEQKEKLSGKILITNPINNSFLTGKIVEKEDSILNCIMDFNFEIPEGTVINKITYLLNDEIKSFEATVQGIENNLVVLNVNKYYEEI